MTQAPYLMDYNQHNVWQYYTSIAAADENFIQIIAWILFTMFLLHSRSYHNDPPVLLY